MARLLKRGLNEYGLGNLDAAIAIWEAVLELEPENRAAFDYLEAAREEAGYAPKKRVKRVPAPLPSRRPAHAGDEADTPRTLEGVLTESEGGGDEVQTALRAYKSGDLERAHDILARVLERDPDRLDVEGYLSMIKSKRAKAWVKVIGDQGRVLRLTVAPDTLRALKLAPDEGFVLSQIDGMLSIDQLLSLQQDRVRALEIVARLIREGIVG